VMTDDGEKRHVGQVTIGRYGNQRGRIIDRDEMDAPGHEELIRRSRERLRPTRPLRPPVTGPERD
jgi:hypothetical protein